MEELVKLNQSLDEEKTKLGDYFCAGKEFNMEECFQVFRNFFQQFNTAIKENKERKEKEEKREKMLKAKREQGASSDSVLQTKFTSILCIVYVI